MEEWKAEIREESGAVLTFCTFLTEPPFPKPNYSMPNGQPSCSYFKTNRLFNRSKPPSPNLPKSPRMWSA